EMRSTKPLVYSCDFNWKVMVENFMECYHHIGLHKNTVEPLMPARLTKTADLSGLYGLMELPFIDTPSNASQNLPHFPTIETLSKAERLRWLVMVVYPTHLFFTTPDSVAHYLVLPEGPNRCELRINLLFPPGTTKLPDFETSLKKAYSEVGGFNE